MINQRGIDHITFVKTKTGNATTQLLQALASIRKMPNNAGFAVGVVAVAAAAAHAGSAATAVAASAFAAGIWFNCYVVRRNARK